MPIHDQGYRRYGGARAQPGRAWAVIATTGIRTRLGQKAFLGLLLVSWIPFFVRAIQIAVAANLPQAAFLAPTPEMFRDTLGGTGFLPTIGWTCVFLVSVTVGSGLIANDRRANGLQIYLSKPLTRAEYVFGKLAVLMVFLLVVTWLPTILLLVLQIALAGNFQFFTNNIYLFPAVTVLSSIQAVTIASVMLALSSLSNNGRYVAILYAVLLFFSRAFFEVLHFVSGNTRLSWISLSLNLSQVGDAIFRLPLRYDTPWPLSLAVLVLLVVASGFVLERRVRGIEVIA